MPRCQGLHDNAGNNHWNIWAGALDPHAQVTKEEVVQTLRRQSKGFQKTSSQYRGVTRHQKGKWEARIGQMVGKKYKWARLLPHQSATLKCPACHVSWHCWQGSRLYDWGGSPASPLARKHHATALPAQPVCGGTGPYVAATTLPAGRHAWA